MKKLFFLIFIVALVVSALIGIVAFIFGDFGDTHLKLLLTTLTVLVFSILGLATSFLYQRGRYLLMVRGGIAVSTVAAGLFLGGIWNEMENDDYWKTSASLAIVAGTIAHVSLLLLVGGDNRWLKYALRATILVAVLLATVLISVISWEELDREALVRLVGVLAILDALGTIGVPILRKVVAPVQ